MFWPYLTLLWVGLGEKKSFYYFINADTNTIHKKVKKYLIAKKGIFILGRLGTLGICTCISSQLLLEPFWPKLGLDRGWSLASFFLTRPQSLKLPSEYSCSLQPFSIFIISFHLCQLIFGILTIFPNFKFASQFFCSLSISNGSQFFVFFIFWITTRWSGITRSAKLAF